MKQKPLVQNRLLFTEILKKYQADIHKDLRGRILIIAGSKGMSGAAILTTEAAYRAGVGKVVLGFPETLKEIYKNFLPIVMTLELPSTSSGSLSLKALEIILKKSENFDVVAVGPGLSQHPETYELVKELVRKIGKILIIDADGLNALAENPFILKNRQFPTIITPHPGELNRWLRLRKIWPDKEVNPTLIDKKKLYFGPLVAQEIGIYVVLKGYETVISSPDGRIVINKSGGPALATSGSGDVLLGIMAALVAQNPNQIFEAISTAVYLHGLAGDLASQSLGERSVIATDIIKYLPEVFKKYI